MIDLQTFFDNLGIFTPSYNFNDQYSFYKTVVWVDGSVTKNQYEFYKKVSTSRYEFFKQYTNETEFYSNINDSDIFNFRTFYENLTGYFPSKFEKPLSCSSEFAVPTIGGQSRPQRLGTCYSFDGASDEIISDKIITGPINNFDIEFNLKTTDSTGCVLGQYKINGNNRSFGFFVEGSLIRLYLSSDGTTNFIQAFNSISITDGIFRKLRWVYDGLSSLLYVDDNLATASSVVGTIPSSLYDADCNFVIGTIDSLSFYTEMSFYGLSIKNNFNTKVQYNCEEESGIISYDSSGNNNNGVITTADIDAFHSTDVDVNKSFANDVGYSNISNQVSNGNFINSDDWTLASGWSISNGQLIGTSTFRVYQSISSTLLEIGQTYIVSYEISTYNSGSVRIDLGSGTTGIINSSAGIFSEIFTLVTRNNLYINNGSRAFNGSITNIKITKLDLVIPRDESDTTKDVLGNDLQYKGKVKYNQNVVDSPCGLFSGDDDYVAFDTDVANVTTNDFSISFDMGLISESSQEYIIAKWDGTTGYFVSVSASRIRCRIQDASASIVWNFTYEITDNNKHSYVLLFDRSSNVTLYIDGVLDVTVQSLATVTGTLTNTTNFTIGSTSIGANNINATISNVRVWNELKTYDEVKRRNVNGLMLDVPIGEKSGGTIYNKVDSTKNGILTTADFDLFWSGLQTGYNDALDNGFSVGVNEFELSEDFNSFSSKINVSIISNSTASPVLSSFADTFKPSTTTGNHYINKTMSDSISGIILTASIYVKLEAGSNINEVTIYTGGNSTFANFNLTLQTIGVESNVTSASIVDAGNGFYRLIVTYPSTHTADRFRIYASSGSIGASITTENGTDGIYIFGCQIVEGVEPLIYMPTYGLKNKGVYIPALSDSSGNDCLNNPIQYPSGNFWNYPPSKLQSVATPELLTKFVQGGTFDGSHYADTNSDIVLDLTKDFACSYYVKGLTNVSNRNIVLGNSGNANTFIGFHFTTYLHIRSDAGNTTGFTGYGTNDYTEGKFEFIKVGGVLTLNVYTLAGVLLATENGVIAETGSITINRISGRITDFRLDGKLFGLKIVEDSITVLDEPLNGIFNNATLTGDVNTFWVEEYNNLLFDSSGVPVSYNPATIDGNYLGLDKLYSDISVDKQISKIVLFKDAIIDPDFSDLPSDALTLYSPNSWINVEDEPLLWLKGNSDDGYYGAYKHDRFKIDGNDCVYGGSNSDYELIENILLGSKSLKTNFTSKLLGKFTKLTTLNLVNNDISELSLKDNLLLNSVLIYSNNFTNITTSGFLIELDENSQTNGTLASNTFAGSLTTEGQLAKDSLETKGWSVNFF